MQKPQTVTEYIGSFPAGVKKKLKEMRSIIKNAIGGKPEEKISYSMAAFDMDGIVVWFGGFKNHVSLFPKASGIAAFKDQLGNYKTSKGAIQFPLDQPLPAELITRIVQHRLAENEAATKKRKKTS